VAARPGAHRPGRGPLTGTDGTTLGSLTAGTRPVRLRRAGAGDLPALVALLADDPLGRTREDGGDPELAPYRRAFADSDADPAHLLVVAVAGEAVVGTLQLSFIPGLARRGARRAQIEAVRVRRPPRRRSRRGDAGLGGRRGPAEELRARAPDDRQVAPGRPPLL
jgi:hypothetical protein